MLVSGTFCSIAHHAFLHNYFDGPTKLFSDLYLVKFLDTSAQLFRVDVARYSLATKLSLRHAVVSTAANTLTWRVPLRWLHLTKHP